MHLHLISTGKQTCDEFIHKVIKIHSQIDRIHLRERNWTAQEHLDVVKRLIEIGVSSEKIIINDRIDIAMAGSLKGVHLASHSIDVSLAKDMFPQMHFGCSVHSVEEAIIQERKGAHYLMYGHIFETDSKAGVPPRGLDHLKQVVTSVRIPVIAIGGIKPSFVEQISQTGASGIAVLSGILLAEDSKRAAELYREKIDK